MQVVVHKALGLVKGEEEMASLLEASGDVPAVVQKLMGSGQDYEV